MAPSEVRSLIDKIPSAPKAERERIAEEIAAVGEAAVPALIEALQHEHRFVRLTAAHVLREIGSAEAVPALIATMGDPYVRVKRAAMGTLIAIGTPAIDRVKEACRFGTAPIRRHALTVLRRLAVRDAAEEALAALESEDDSVRREAVKLLLISEGDEAFEAAVDCLSDPEVAETVAHHLLETGERGRQVLLEAAQGTDRVARRAAAVVLAKEGGPGTLGALLDSYADGELPVSWEAPGFIEAAVADGREVPFEQLLEQAGGKHLEPDDQWGFHSQRPAIEALGKVGDARAVPVLAELLASEHAVIGRTAARALAGIGTDECIQLLTDALGGPQTARGEAASALASIGERALPQVLAALGSENRAQRENAALVLSVWGQPAVPGLLQGTQSTRPTERWAALFGLTCLARRHPDAIGNEIAQAAARGLGDEDPRVRRWGARLCAELGPQAPIDALVAHLTDEDRRTRRVCRESVGVLGEVALQPVLRAIPRSDSPWTSQMLGKALGAIGEAAVEAALELAESPNRLVRCAAGVALGECGCPDSALPGLTKLAREDDTDVAAFAMWGLGDIPREAAIETLDYVAANEKLERSVRDDARYYARELRERVRLAEEEPPNGDQAGG
jgi:HEAT repeat protein